MFRHIFELLIFGLIFVLVLGAIFAKEFSTLLVFANGRGDVAREVEYTIKTEEKERVLAKFKNSGFISHGDILVKSKKEVLEEEKLVEKTKKPIKIQPSRVEQEKSSCYFSEKTFPREMIGYFSRPAEGYISDNYGCLSRTGRNHDGLDIAGRSGSDIKSSAGGVVFYTKNGCSNDGYVGEFV